MRKVLILFMIFVIFGMTQSGRIMMDQQNPIQLNPPHKDVVAGQDLTFRFRLPINSLTNVNALSGGLNYGQFIAVQFPDGVFTFTSDNKPTCNLKQGAITFDTESVVGVSSPLDTNQSTSGADTNIAYCMLVDLDDEVVPANEDLVLTLSLPGKISATYLHELSLFTVTSNNPDGQIIDFVTSVGSLGQYADYRLSNNNKILVANSLETIITKPSSPPNSSVIRPYYEIDVKVQLEVKNLWVLNSKDFVILITYDTNAYTIPSGVSSEAVSGELGSALRGNVNIPAFGSDGFLVTGIQDDDLIPNRKFKLVLTNWNCLDTGVDLTTSLKIYVLYRNTYSVVSYSEIAMKKIEKININVSQLSHPEYFTLFDGMAWPLKFCFSASDDCESGGYVVIRQSGKNDASSLWSFVASTCDFTGTDITAQSFGQRWNCYPLRNDFGSNSLGSESGVEGSGIFFRMVRLTANASNCVTVWGFAERCGTSNADVTTSTGLAAARTQFSFIVRIYRRYVWNATGINRFAGQIATSTTKAMSQYCYGGQDLPSTAAGLNTFLAASGEEKSVVVQEVTNFMTTNIAYESSYLTNSILLDYEAEKLFVPGAAKNNFLYFDSANNQTTVEQFIYGSSSTNELAASYIFIGAVFPLGTTGGANVAQVVVSTCNSTTVDNVFLNFRVELIFSKMWVDVGDYNSGKGCLLSWGFDENALGASDQTSGAADVNTNLIPHLSDAQALVNYIVQNGTDVNATEEYSATIGVGTVDTCRLSGGVTRQEDIYKIVSSYNPILFYGKAAANCDATTFTNPNANTTGWFELGMFTSCAIWYNNASPPTVTSLYTYLDIQFQVIYQPTSTKDATVDAPLRVLRYIKLFPEVGIFQSEDTISDVSTSTRFMTAHYAFTYGSQAPYALCLIEIDGTELTASIPSGTTASTLVLFLFSTTLVDVDYESPSSEYPAAPLVSNIQVFGLNAGQTVSTMNRLVSDGTNIHPQSYSNTAFNYLELYYFSTIGNYRNLIDIATTTVFVAGGFKARTMYQFFMGSAIYFRGVNSGAFTASSGNTQPNLLIPFLCPESTTASTGSTHGNGIAFGVPYAMASWIEMSSFNSVKKVDAWIRGNSRSIPSYTVAASSSVYIAKGSFENGTTLPLMTMPLYRIPNSEASASNLAQQDLVTMNTFQYTTTSYPSSTTKVHHCTIRFKKYSDITDSNTDVLEVFGARNTATTTAVQTTTNVSALAMLFNSQIEVKDNAVASLSNITTIYSRALSVGVFVGNQRFTRFVGGSIGVSNVAAFQSKDFSITGPNPRDTENPTTYISGIVRPSIELFTVDGEINFQNWIGISLVSAAGNEADNSFVLTNFVPGLTTTVGSFILDIPFKEVEDFVVSIDNDDSNESFANDLGGNLRVTVDLPDNVTAPVGSKLRLSFGSNIINDGYTICALDDVNTLARPCTAPVGAVVTCDIEELSTTFSVCCYNVNTANTFSLSSEELVFPTASNTVLNYRREVGFYSTSLETYTNPSTDIINNSSDKFGLIVAIQYYQSIPTIGGLGKAVIDVDLPRAPVRGSTIVVNVDLSENFVTNVAVECRVNFGTLPLFGSIRKEGDNVLDSCLVQTDSVSIKMKNIIYKCQSSFSRSIKITLFPVLTPNYTALANSVEMYLSSTSNLITNVSSTTSSKPTLTFTPPDVNFQTDSLCSVSTIYPRIIGEVGYYVIDFNVKSVVTQIEGFSINEATVYLPYSYFDSRFTSVCYHNNNSDASNRVHCSFNDEALNIRFNGPLTLSQDEYISVTVWGIMNVGIPVNGDRILCSFNNSNYVTGERKNIVLGTGLVTDGLSHISNATFGHLRLWNSLFYQRASRLPESATTNNLGQNVDGEVLGPRDNPAIENSAFGTLHNYQFSFDTSNFLTSLQSDLVINNNPCIVVTFPDEYNIYWFTRSYVARLLINVSASDDILNLTTTIKTPSSINVIGNQVKLCFSDESWTFTKFFRHFILKIYNIPSPLETTVNSTINKQTTGRFNILITNSDHSQNFRVFTNLNSQANVARATVPNNYLPMNRGFKFEYSQTRWIIDIITTASIYNILTAYTGRYNLYYIRARTNSRVLNGANVYVQLDSSVSNFSFSESPIQYATYYVQNYPIYLGAACSEVPGFYILPVNIIQVDRPYSAVATPSAAYTLVVPTSLLQVTLLSGIANKGTITLNDNYNCRKSGSIFLYYNLNYLNYERLFVNFEPTVDSKIDNTVIEPLSSRARTVFRMLNDKGEITVVYTTENIQASDSLLCWSITPTEISFVISGITAVIPNLAIVAGDFTYYTSATSDNISLADNSILFVFESDYTQIYLFCVLVCFNNEFPTNDQLRSGDYVENETLSVHYALIDTSINAPNGHQIIFNGLIRNQPYKLKCFIESTEGDETQRTSSQVILFNYTYPDTLETVDIVAKATIPLVCAYYRFKSRPGTQVTLPLITTWQYTFSGTGWLNNGCITVVDQYGFRTPGLPLPINPCNSDDQLNFSANTTYNPNETQTNDTLIYQVCPIPNPVCGVDPQDYAQKVAAMIEASSSNNSFLLATHDIAVVPELNVTTISDASAPEFPIVSASLSQGNQLVVVLTARPPPSGSASNAETVIRCFGEYFIDSTQSGAPTINDLRSCSGNTCFQEIIDQNGLTVTRNLGGSPNDRSVVVYAVCYNAIPFAQTPTAVTQVFQGTIPGSNPNNNNGTNNNGTTGSASGINVWFMGLLLLIMTLMFE